MRAWRGCLVKEKILEVVDLCKEYPVKRGALLPKEIGMVHAVNHVSFTLYQGETLGIIAFRRGQNDAAPHADGVGGSDWRLCAVRGQKNTQTYASFG